MTVSCELFTQASASRGESTACNRECALPSPAASVVMPPLQEERQRVSRRVILAPSAMLNMPATVNAAISPKPTPSTRSGAIPMAHIALCTATEAPNWAS